MSPPMMKGSAICIPMSRAGSRKGVPRRRGNGEAVRLDDLVSAHAEGPQAGSGAGRRGVTVALFVRPLTCPEAAPRFSSHFRQQSAAPTRGAEMHATMRYYAGNTDLADQLASRTDEIRAVISAVPGFQAYLPRAHG